MIFKPGSNPGPSLTNAAPFIPIPAIDNNSTNFEKIDISQIKIVTIEEFQILQQGIRGKGLIILNLTSTN